MANFFELNVIQQTGVYLIIVLILIHIVYKLLFTKLLRSYERVDERMKADSVVRTRDNTERYLGRHLKGLKSTNFIYKLLVYGLTIAFMVFAITVKYYY